MYILLDQIIGAIFWSGVVLVAAGLPACLFMRGIRLKNSFFISAVIVAVSWRMATIYLGYFQSRRYLLPAAALIILLMPAAAWLVCRLTQKLLRLFGGMPEKNRRLAGKFLACTLICSVVAINIAKSFHSSAPKAELEVISSIKKHLDGAEKTSIITNVKTGMRLKRFVPAADVHMYNHDVDTDTSERNIDKLIYELALSGRDFIMVLSESVKHPDVPLKTCLKQQLGVFPFDPLFSVTGKRNAYHAYRYNRKIGVSGAPAEIVGAAELAVRKSRSEHLVDLSPLLGRDEFATLSDPNANCDIRNGRLRICGDAPVAGKNIRIFICNSISWPVREYIGEFRNIGNSTVLKMVLGRQAERKPADPGECFFSVNRIPKVFVPSEGGSIVGDRLFLPPVDAEVRTTIGAPGTTAGSTFNIPGGYGRTVLEVDMRNPTPELGARWNVEVFQPRAPASAEKKRILFIGCSLERNQCEKVFSQSLRAAAPGSEVDFHYLPDVSFYTFEKAIGLLKEISRDKTYDFVIFNIGANDVLWGCAFWLDPRLAAARTRELTALFREMTSRFPDTRFAMIIPQQPAPGEAFYLQGIPADWRMKTKTHNVLSNVLYEVEKDLKAKNLAVVPAFCGIERNDYIPDGGGRGFQYTFIMSPRGYEKIAKSTAAWLSVNMAGKR